MVAADRGRFAVLGEAIVAVDLIDTITRPGSATAADLLPDAVSAAAWWRLESGRVPPGDLPDVHALRRLRAALRATIEAVLDAAPAPAGAVADLNFFMRSAPVSTRLTWTAAGPRAQPWWHREYGGNARLAFVATEAAEFLSDPAKARLLRRCANPACRMIFVAVNPRRAWCVPGVCGNRVRVARHYRRAGA